jgi:DedD protein
MAPLGTLPADEAIDTEITLGTGKMLALFFGLVILCAVFFGMGFTMGKNSVRSAPELLPSPGTAMARPAARTATAPAPAPQATTEQAPSTSSTPASADTSSPSSASQTAPAVAQDQAAPAIPTQPGQAYYVQVAAVSKQEDAEALVESLKGRQYSAFIVNQPSDKLFHVQVGPFTDIKQAEDMRAKLVSDGYSPILKK